MEKIRLNKYIAECGVCSRREAERYIINGRVKLNDKVITQLATLVTDNDIIKIDDNIIKQEDKKIYIMYNKKKKEITTSKEQFNRKKVTDNIKIKERIFSVGRLDMDSEGLLLLTNDGYFANKIIHPTSKIVKTYEVTLKEKIDSNSISKLEKGIDIGGYVTKPAKIKKINDKKIIMEITEGKNRQIRRMIEAVQNRVISLKRIAIGNLKLGNLRSGEYIFLSNEDIKKIFSN